MERSNAVCAYLPSISTIQHRLLLKRIKKRVLALEKDMFDPHTITLEGIDTLPGISGQHWTSRLYSLFTHANLPHAYILSIETFDKINDMPKTAVITVITYRVKLYSFYSLLQYFAEHRKDINISKN